MPVRAVHAPIALPRATPVKFDVIRASELGTSSAAATPCRMRAITSTTPVGASAQASDMMPNQISPARITRTRPKVSESEPAIRMSALKLSK